jgi:hypothetical protein
MRANKMRTVQFIAVYSVFVAGALAQGDFQNLDFESPNVAGYSAGNSIPIDIAFLGWSGYYISATSTNQAVTITYNAISLGGAAITVQDGTSANGFYPLEGNFSALLFGTGSAAGITSVISQTGMVPADAHSLQLFVGTYDGFHNGPFAVSLGGQEIAMTILASYSAYTVYGGDISSLAGQTAALTIAAPPALVGEPNMVSVDHIVFSSATVPEPGVFSLLALGMLGLVWRRNSRI